MNDHPFRVGDRIRYIHERRHGNANLLGRLHCVRRVYFMNGCPWVDLCGVENRMRRDTGPGLPAGAFVLVARPGSVTA